MIRIGFDPSLEAQAQHQELIRETEQLRLARDGSVGSQSRLSATARMLAMLGKELVSLGEQLEERYTVKEGDCISISTLYSDDVCSS